MTDDPPGPDLAAELTEVRARLAEAEQHLQAIRNGHLDGVLSTGERGEQIGALRGTHRIYRQLIETMSEGAATLCPDGTIGYCNVRVAQLLGQPLDHVLDAALHSYLPPADQPILEGILARAQTETSRGEITLVRSDGRVVPVYLSAFRQQTDAGDSVCCLVLTDLTQQKSHEQIVAAEKALRENQQRLAEAQALAKIGNWETDLATKQVIWSDEIYRLFEADPGTFGASHAAFLAFVHPDDRASVDTAFARSFDSRSVNAIEHRIVTPNGVVKIVEERWRILPDEHGRAVRAVGTTQDITESKRAEEDKATLEAKLQQAQKMDSVGRLAGGVAHDFNNMLGVILGHAELALSQASPGQPIHADLQEICDAAMRSAQLTRQLLAFARKQTIAPKVLDLNRTVPEMLTMLRRLIGEQIDVAWQPETGLWHVKVDPSQIDQILVNLCINSRDAIDGVGTLTIATANRTIDEPFCAVHADALPGAYVSLTVRDNGCGMDRETVACIFEPFFTTKAMGRGTGLGLATVYGIVTQNHGFITVDSRPGHGTAFGIYLPRHVSTAEQAPTADAAPPVQSGHGTILLVEDEPAVLTVTTRMLEQQGYTVLAAGTPRDATRAATISAGAIDLLVTDVIMPEQNGRDLAEALRSVYPDLKVLFMSGYTADVIAHQGVLDEGVHFIQKPFTREALTTAVRIALDAPP